MKDRIDMYRRRLAFIRSAETISDRTAYQTANDSVFTCAQSSPLPRWHFVNHTWGSYEAEPFVLNDIFINPLFGNSPWQPCMPQSDYSDDGKRRTGDTQSLRHKPSIAGTIPAP